MTRWTSLKTETSESNRIAPSRTIPRNSTLIHQFRVRPNWRDRRARIEIGRNRSDPQGWSDHRALLACRSVSRNGHSAPHRPTGCHGLYEHAQVAARHRPGRVLVGVQIRAAAVTPVDPFQGHFRSRCPEAGAVQWRAGQGGFDEGNADAECRGGPRHRLCRTTVRFRRVGRALIGSCWTSCCYVPTRGRSQGAPLWRLACTSSETAIPRGRTCP